MMTHSDVWRAIEFLAVPNGLRISELARQAGLDRPIFAKSKRCWGSRPRWPSTESLSRILQATHSDMSQFSTFLRSHAGQGAGLHIPIIGLVQAGWSGYFDDSGYPSFSGWDTLNFLNLCDGYAYALEICGESMELI